MTNDIWWNSSDGLELYAKAYGPADSSLTVLCMHGLTRNRKDFEPMISALSGQYRFISVDVRGRGASERDPNPENYSPSVYAGDMISLLDHLGLRSVALIGTSMGGLMSMIMMKIAPQRVRGVVLNDVGPTLEKSGLARIASYASEVEPLPNWQSAANTVANVQASIFPDYGPDDWMAFAKRTYTELDTGEVILDYDPEITRSVGEAQPGLMVRIAMWRLFKSMYARPLLITRGETSDILSAKTAEKMVKRHPNAELVTIPGRGHAPMLDEPRAIQALENFLSSRVLP